MREHARIAKYFAPLSADEFGAFMLRDDAAILQPPPAAKIVVTTDSVIEGIHVLSGASAQYIATKLLRRNLSDLAAMGAKPWRYSLNLHTPVQTPDDWFAAFATTLAAEQTHFGCTLIGGDCTSGDHGPIHTTLTCFGLIEETPLLRSGAQVGDSLYVSGTLGDAAFALQALQQGAPINDTLAARYHQPEPRVALGIALCELATSCLDISDGLLADAHHLAHASGIGLTIRRDALPLSPTLRDAVARDAALWHLPLSGGDDYELLFTAPASAKKMLHAIAQKLSLPLTRIGEVIHGSGVELLDADGKALEVQNAGWEY